ncbi:AsnC family transcriptional regulator [Microbacterium hominis]|uniref:AsnC family transcriptional regulator n=1 Tax=Microbacterium hominis TaxID=162426 RepID=A0A7D4UGA7_9MICO|nr:AsnC family transcriptional regulator [Microbacterium hominis]QKJ19369.1 AsnC family transcriptional regulator [Microbacterium hominis]
MVRDDWTFLSNHGHALVCVAADPHVRLRDVAAQLRVTERCAQQIVSELEASGVIQRTRTGRRNTYVVHRHARFRHPLESHLTVGEFIDLVSTARSSADEASTDAPPSAA